MSTKLSLVVSRSASITPKMPPIAFPVSTMTAPNVYGPAPGERGRKLAVLLAGQDSYVFDVTDPGVRVEDAGHIVWSEIPHPDALPYLVSSGRRLRKLNVKGTIYKGGVPIDTHLRNLQYMSSRPTVMTFAYGDYETGQFRMTSLSIETTVREAGTNNVLAATCEFTLTEANDLPTPKPIPTAPPPSAPPPAAPASTPAKTVYVVKKGDTLWAIAQRFYGAGQSWTRIAEANGVKDPRRLQIGQNLVIPA